ncbi:MAG: ATP-grasp domain-containing protein [Gammaproteobacteria bacterium]|nr:ATP-grasp domain-containing protein [Gammaproteobacteria bacterium]
MSGTVVILGKRKPALAAAARLGLPVVLVHDRPIAEAMRRCLRGFIAADLDRPPEDWGAVAEQLRAYGPLRAVLAASERTVRAAAWLRRQFQLPGAGELEALLATDKLAMKAALKAAGLPVADFIATTETTSGQALAQRLGLPLVLKEQRGYGGRGTRMIHRAEEVPESVPAHWLAERVIEGVELSVESFVQDGQIRFAHISEYFMPRFCSVSPNRLDADSERALLALNRGAIAALGLSRGLTHLEAFVTRQGPVFGEIALRPPGGHLMNVMARAYGFDPWAAWLRLELGEPLSLSAVPLCHAAVYLLHPGGPGRLAAVRGWEAARTAPGVVEAELHVHAGSLIAEREGSGQESGYLLATGASREAALCAVLAARRELDFQLLPAAS